MRSWVSCEEKLALLERMYRIARENLSKSDEAVYRALRRELAQRAETVKVLTDKVEYARSEDAPRVGSPKSPPRATLDAKELSVIGPEEVVKVFVSCWDDQDFHTEYALLSQTFRRAEGTPATVEEYVKQRKAKHSARVLTGQIAKHLDSIVSSQIAGQRALIDCIEIRKWHTSTAAQRRRYHLRKYGDGWKIDYFENLVS